jgi:hypothetical protein
MMNIERKIDLLKQEIKKEDFLSGKRMGGEIPFHIFDYLPKDELIIREETRKIIKQLQKENIVIVEIDIYELCLKIIKSKGYTENVIQLEKTKGSNKLLKKLKVMLDFNLINSEILKILQNNYDVVFFTGIGKVWPLLRSHNLLNNLQNIIEKPLILFYPGQYTGQDLSLFGLFESSNYYRANKIINNVRGKLQ